MTEITTTINSEAPDTTLGQKNKRIKGILSAIVYALTAAAYIVIPTKLISNYWMWLNEFNINGKPVYTLALLMLFLYIITWVIAVVYIAATVRAIVQGKNSDLGISKGIQWFGAISTAFMACFFILWFVLTGGQIAIFSLTPP
ncbi:MAG: hypothetical protein JW891_06510 [Candidatus Lokiarchaeota archaeon]|nr:hypothetical protein [Candidatus Lokiarchaeota archaeon]